MAYVLSSVSGNLISAASAGFAPTNSADVSAIASAYQVVSATSTQLYAGTAYLTSINEAPVSAARAGNAANASLANSAYYDGTGRLISALPDNATVSAIASSYAESAASSKQDTLTFGYDTSDNISSINGSSIGGQGGGGLVTAIGTSADNVTSINGSALLDTAALRSADYSSLYVQEPLYISSTGDSSYIGISGDIGGSASLPISGTGSLTFFGTALSGTGTLNYSSLRLRQETEYGASARGVSVDTSISVYAESDPREIFHSTFISPSLIGVNYSDGDNQIFYTADIAASATQLSHSEGFITYSTKYNCSAVDFIEYDEGNIQTVATINKSSVSAWNAKMDSTAVQSAYASASATQATAQNVLYILIPDGV